MRFGRLCETPNIRWQLTLEFWLVALCSFIFIPPMLNDCQKSNGNPWGWEGNKLICPDCPPQTEMCVGCICAVKVHDQCKKFSIEIDFRCETNKCFELLEGQGATHGIVSIPWCTKPYFEGVLDKLKFIWKGRGGGMVSMTRLFLKNLYFNLV